MKTKDLKTLEKLQEMSETSRQSLLKSIVEFLDSIAIHPHNRLGYPSRVKGQDVHVSTLTMNATLEEHKRLSRS